MAWSWSHSQEAYANAQANLEDLPREVREVIYAEWRAVQTRKKTDYNDHDHFDERRYQRALAWVKTSDDADDTAINEFIWIKAEAQATCTNGGWEAWLCPYGCHLVSFDRVRVLSDK